MNSRHHLELQLAQELNCMGAEYAATLEQVEALGTCNPEQREAQLARVRQRVAAMATHEQRLAPLRSRWSELRAAPGPALQAALTGQERLLSDLIARVRHCEAQLAGERSRMLPAVDAQVRRTEMHRAYQKHGRSY